MSVTREAKHAARRSARPDRVARTALGALARDPALVLLLTIGAALGAVVMSFESFLPAELRTRWGAEGVSMVLGAAMAAAWFAYLGLGLTTPVLSAAFHARVASGERATMLSVQSLAAYAGGVAATLVLGFVAEASGLATVWLTVAAVAGGAAVTAFAWRDRHAWRPTADALRHSD